MKLASLRNLAICIVVALAATLAVSSCTHTPQFRGTSSQILPNSIAEERRMILGGEEQYVLIRGKDRRAPILLFLHGGPGTSAMAFNRIHNSGLEDHVVFVNWDQRGTGKSIKAGKPGSLTLAQMTADLDELVDQLRAEFQKEKILIVGHSWGSMLGLDYVAAHPEKVSAFVGIGQMAHTQMSETRVYEWALQTARERNDDKAIQILEEIGAPPYASMSELMRHRGVVSKYGGSWIKPKSDFAYAREVIRAPEFAWTELTTILRGGDISGDALFDTFNALNAFESYPAIDVPVYFFEGRHDRVVSPSVAAEYLQELEAPQKQLVWFENSAHSPQWEEPKKYAAEILRVLAETRQIPTGDVFRSE